VLANYLRDKLPADEQRALGRLAADPQLSDRDRVSLLFGLAQVCDGASRYDEAAEQLAEANALDLGLRRQAARTLGRCPGGRGHPVSGEAGGRGGGLLPDGLAEIDLRGARRGAHGRAGSGAQHQADRWRA